MTDEICFKYLMSMLKSRNLENIGFMMYRHLGSKFLEFVMTLKIKDAIKNRKEWLMAYKNVEAKHHKF